MSNKADVIDEASYNEGRAVGFADAALDKLRGIER